jgi:hypothetical protein
MRGNLRSRIEKLEWTMAHKGRVFCMFDDSNQYDDYADPDLDARISAFRAENAVGPHDTIMVVQWRAPTEAA